MATFTAFARVKSIKRALPCRCNIGYDTGRGFLNVRVVSGPTPNWSATLRINYICRNDLPHFY